jgi:hypothetical protein
MAYGVTSFNNSVVYFEENEYPKHAANSGNQTPNAPACFYHWNGGKHFPNLHPAEGSRKTLHILGTNLLEKTAKLPEGFCTLH